MIADDKAETIAADTGDDVADDKPAGDAAPVGGKRTSAPAADRATDTGDAPRKASATLADDGDDDAPETSSAKTPAAWPEDWREKWAGDDAKLLKRLQRFASPDGVVKSWRAAEQKLSSGEYGRKAPEDGTPEEMAAWRKEMGLPESPDEYEPTSVEGHQWTKEDQPLLESLFGKAHAANMSQGQIDAVLGFYAETMAQAAEQRTEADRTFKRDAEDALREEFGKDYRAHMRIYARVLEDPEVFPGDAGAVLASARTADGMRLINHPDVARALVALGLDRYGSGGLITGEAQKATQSRKAEIEKIRDTDVDRYFREKLDEELLAIMRAEEGAKPRRGRAA